MSKKITTLEAEETLAEVIDTIYLSMKHGFCDYKNQTHKLGFFKERVKAEFSIAILNKKLWLKSKSRE